MKIRSIEYFINKFKQIIIPNGTDKHKNTLLYLKFHSYLQSKLYPNLMFIFSDQTRIYIK